MKKFLEYGAALYCLFSASIVFASEKYELLPVTSILLNLLQYTNQLNTIRFNLNINIVDSEGEKSIAFFDFCGFENYYSYKYNNIIYLNSLEQLFINYMNELIFYFYLKDNYLTNLQLFLKEGFYYLVDEIQKEYDNKQY